MGKFHFYTNSELFNNQSPADAFGYHTYAGGKDKFRITSMLQLHHKKMILRS
jgi:hypothetical protein